MGINKTANFDSGEVKMSLNQKLDSAQELLNTEISKVYKEQCSGCRVNHPSQDQHDCFEFNYSEVYRLSCDNLFLSNAIDFVEYHFLLSFIEGTPYKTLE